MRVYFQGLEALTSPPNGWDGKISSGVRTTGFVNKF